LFNKPLEWVLITQPQTTAQSKRCLSGLVDLMPHPTLLLLQQYIHIFQPTNSLNDFPVHAIITRKFIHRKYLLRKNSNTQISRYSKIISISNLDGCAKYLYIYIYITPCDDLSNSWNVTCLDIWEFIIFTEFH